LALASVAKFSTKFSNLVTILSWVRAPKLERRLDKNERRLFWPLSRIESANYIKRRLLYCLK
jgi:hypothetical protein